MRFLYKPLDWFYEFKLYAYYWPYGFRRVLRGKKVCRSCFYYPGACRHIDREVWEALAKRIEEDRLGIRPLPRIKLSARKEDNE